MIGPAFLVRVVRGSKLWYVVPLAVALEVPTGIEGHSVLGRNWPSTVEVANGSAVLLVILAAVTACAASIQWSAHDRSLPLATLRGGLFRLLPTVVVGGLIAIAHCLWFLGVLVVRADGTSGDLGPIALVPAVLAISAGAALGSAAGGMSRTWLVPPVLGVAMYVLLINVRGTAFANFFSLGGIGMPLVGIEVRGDVVAWQAAWYLAILMSGVALVLAGLRRGLLVFAVVGSSVMLAVAGLGLHHVGNQRFTLADSGWHCKGDAPRFCVLDESRGRLEAAYPSLAEADRRWRALATAPTPDAYWQRLDLPVPGHDAVFPVSGLRSAERLVQGLVTASYPCSDRWTYEQYQSLVVVTQAVLGDGLSATGWSPDARRSEVAARIAELDC